MADGLLEPVPEAAHRLGARRIAAAPRGVRGGVDRRPVVAQLAVDVERLGVDDDLYACPAGMRAASVAEPGADRVAVRAAAALGLQRLAAVEQPHVAAAGGDQQPVGLDGGDRHQRRRACASRVTTRLLGSVVLEPRELRLRAAGGATATAGWSSRTAPRWTRDSALAGSTVRGRARQRITAASSRAGLSAALSRTTSSTSGAPSPITAIETFARHGSGETSSHAYAEAAGGRGGEDRRRARARTAGWAR